MPVSHSRLRSGIMWKTLVKFHHLERVLSLDPIPGRAEPKVIQALPCAYLGWAKSLKGLYYLGP